MPRAYEVTFGGVACSAAQDFVQITGATGKMMEILRFWLSAATDTSLATGQGVQVRCSYLPATVTVGSGGTTGITPSKKDPGDAACASSTCAINNTTPASTNATAVRIWQDACHLYQGLNIRFDNPPEIGPSTAFVFELLSTPSGTVHLSGGVEFVERG